MVNAPTLAKTPNISSNDTCSFILVCLEECKDKDLLPNEAPKRELFGFFFKKDLQESKKYVSLQPVSIGTAVI